MPAPASYESLEAKELGLVGKLELRIALADSDTKLESLLRTYLAPLLLKLASEHVAVRNKVRLLYIVEEPRDHISVSMYVDL